MRILHLCLLLPATLLGSATALAECQNIAGITQTQTASLGFARMYGARGVDCEIGVTGIASVEPPADHSEGFDHAISRADAPQQLGRELGVKGDTRLPRLTVERQVFGPGSVQQRAPELDFVIESSPGLPKTAVVLWRSFPPDASEMGVTRRLLELPVTSAVIECAGTPGMNTCLRTTWKALASSGAQVTVELFANGQKQAQTLGLPLIHADAPSLRLGYVSAVRGSDNGGTTWLRHRVCHMINNTGHNEPLNLCKPDMTLTARSNPRKAKAEKVYKYMVQVSNDELYEVVRPLTVSLPPTQDVSYLSAAGPGWNCSTLPTKVSCTRNSAPVGNLPEITVEARASNNPHRYVWQQFVLISADSVAESVLSATTVTTELE